MDIDLSAVRRDTEKLEDSTQRDEALRDLAGLENAEVDLKQRLAEINREHWKKYHAYKPQSKFRLVLIAILSLLGSLAMLSMVSDILATGHYTLSRTRDVITVEANPIAYWLYAGGFTLGVVCLMFALLFCVLVLLRYPHPPFKRMPRQRTS